MEVTIYSGDLCDRLSEIEADSIDAIVTDPPYHLTAGKRGGIGPASMNLASPPGRSRIGTGFMGMAWDGGDVAMRPETWAAVLRVAKPGAHLVAFGGTRTFHRIWCAIEDAGWEIRDTLMWLYGQGFPKSSNQSDDWQGWGTALKPSYEPVILARKSSNEWVTIGRQIVNLWCHLWSIAPASVAESNSPSNPAACGADVSAFVRWSAEQQRNTRADLSDQMGTSLFESAMRSSLSTVSSWNAILAASSRLASTSIIETATEPTIDLRTLRFCLSRLTPQSIIQAHRSGAWCSADACNAARYLNATAAELSATRERFALARAIAPELPNFLGEDARFPSFEPIVLARKPLAGTVGENLQRYGVGALNIDGCRIPAGSDDLNGGAYSGELRRREEYSPTDGGRAVPLSRLNRGAGEYEQPDGRWPANVLHDGSDEVVEAFPDSDGAAAPVHRRGSDKFRTTYGSFKGHECEGDTAYRGDSGSAARFFWCPKASQSDRNDGLQGMPNHHPTVKPTELMQWLCRLVTTPGGTVLDPFMGSGSTGKAAVLEGMHFLGIELDRDYIEIARRRIESRDPLFTRAAVK